MISTILMLSVAAVLSVTFYAARESRIRQGRLERENEAMQRELASHRATAQSILRELQNV